MLFAFCFLFCSFCFAGVGVGDIGGVAVGDVVDGGADDVSFSMTLIVYRGLWVLARVKRSWCASCCSSVAIRRSMNWRM